tara:strand:+ start:842 stop:1033 length:192 start_codon:yes stop_codon:yes gene_type:complete
MIAKYQPTYVQDPAKSQVNDSYMLEVLQRIKGIAEHSAHETVYEHGLKAIIEQADLVLDRKTF